MLHLDCKFSEKKELCPRSVTHLIFESLSDKHKPQHDLAYDVLRFHLSPTGNFLYKVDTPTS
ncbi:hypothetical protein EI056_15550 [Escherichia coli]|nr:hypothetical protein [Escherichia coli]